MFFKTGDLDQFGVGTAGLERHWALFGGVLAHCWAGDTGVGAGTDKKRIKAAFLTLSRL